MAAPTYRRGSGVWTKLNRLVISVIIFCLCVGGAVAFIPLLQKRSAQAQRLNELRTQIARETSRIERNTRAVELLRNDPEYISLIARDRLDLMKPGETIIRIDTEGKVLPLTPAAAAAVVPGP